MKEADYKNYLLMEDTEVLLFPFMLFPTVFFINNSETKYPRLFTM